MKKVIELQNIKRDFQVGEETVHALRGVSFTINEGEFVTIMGTSGSGKSTLLNTLGCLDYPNQRRVSARRNLRPHNEQTSTGGTQKPENRFCVPELQPPPQNNGSRKRGVAADVQLRRQCLRRRRRAIESLQAVGLGDRLEHKSNQMSGGQMQRVAIARALVNNPAVILADEATGNLDTRTSFEILVLFQKLHAEGRTIIFVTHNPEIAQYSSRNIRLRDGHITEDTVNTKILSAAEALAALPKMRKTN